MKTCSICRSSVWVSGWTTNLWSEKWGWNSQRKASSVEGLHTGRIGCWSSIKLTNKTRMKRVWRFRGQRKIVYLKIWEIQWVLRQIWMAFTSRRLPVLNRWNIYRFVVRMRCVFWRMRLSGLNRVIRHCWRGWGSWSVRISFWSSDYWVCRDNSWWWSRRRTS